MTVNIPNTKLQHTQRGVYACECSKWKLSILEKLPKLIDDHEDAQFD